MWAKAAKAIAKFEEGVITALDTDGYPVSVRQTKLPYDAQSGTMAVTLPEALGAAPGPANLLCHFHDDKLWSLRSIEISGRVERRDGGWRFVTEKFDPPSTIAMIRGMQSSMKAYLARRNLPVPVVDFAAVKRMQANAKRIQNP